MNSKLPICVVIFLAMIFSASAMAEEITGTLEIWTPEVTAVVDEWVARMKLLAIWAAGIIFVSVVIIALILVGALILSGRWRKNHRNWDAFYLSPHLMTPNEARFYKQLCQAVGGAFSIHSKVRMEDVIKVKHQGISKKERDWKREHVKSRHFDFVLLNDSGEIFCAIELDDSTHARPDRQRSDEIKNELAAAVGLKLLRFESGRDYPAESIARAIAEN